MSLVAGVSDETREELERIRGRVFVIKDPQKPIATISRVIRFKKGDSVVINTSTTKVIGIVLAVLAGGKIKVKYQGSWKGKTRTIVRTLGSSRVKKIHSEKPP